MNCSISTGILTMAFIAAVMPGGIFAQPDQGPREIAAHAKSLYAAGDSENARNVLMDGIEQCGDDENATPCRLLMYYSLGYLEQRLSTDESDLARMHLERAKGYYDRVIETQPGHGPTLNNLALVHAGLGEDKDAVSLLEKAAKSDAARAADYLLLVGDLHRENKDYKAAIRSYERAAYQREGWNTPLRRIVAVYGSLPDERLSEILERCAEWETSAPDVALMGYEFVMSKGYRAQTVLAERALLNWVELMATQSRLTPGSLGNLPSEWESDAAVQLRLFVRDPRSRTRWWTRNNERKQVLATAAAALGRHASVHRDAGAAVAYWHAGLQRAPHINAYLYDELVGQRIIRLDLATDLASLAVQNPKEETGFDLNDLEEDLYIEKADAYRAKNLEAIQRYHTVLGIIYSDRGIWTSQSRYQNGIFQLSNAIRTAKIRQKRTGFYQPLPDLKRRLAKGYLAFEKPEETKKAHELFIAAGQAYLDTDQLDKAGQMLDKAKLLNPGAEKDVVAQLFSILELRKILTAGAAGDVESRPPVTRDRIGRWTFTAVKASPTALTKGKTPFLYPGNNNVLDEAFLARQRFKLIADEAGTSNPTGAAEALNTAVENKIALIGAADLNRLGKAQKVVLKSLGPNEIKSPYKMLLSSHKTPTSSSLNVVLPGQSSPSVAEVSADTVLAARVSAMPEFDWSANRPQIMFDNGKVFIYTEKGLNKARWVDVLKNNPGATVTVTKHPLPGRGEPQ